MYVVYFTGEYDLDENGGVIPLIKSYKNKEAAFAAAQEWEQNTGNIANIEQIEQSQGRANARPFCCG